MVKVKKNILFRHLTHEKGTMALTEVKLSLTQVKTTFRKHFSDTFGKRQKHRFHQNQRRPLSPLTYKSKRLALVGSGRIGRRILIYL